MGWLARSMMRPQSAFAFEAPPKAGGCTGRAVTREADGSDMCPPESPFLREASRGAFPVAVDGQRDWARSWKRVQDFVELTKPRLVLMVLVTAGVGFYLGSTGGTDAVRIVPTLIGTALAAAGALVLNQFAERDVDARMQRTRQRPLPDGRVQPWEALAFGTLLTLAGLACLALGVNLLSGVVTGVTAVTYLFAYTPLKRQTPLCTIVGAIPGALPPVTGWVAARSALGIEAWVLFSILFLWQLPHSLAIARLYRDDYARGGIKLLPVVEPDGRSTARQVVTNCLALLAVGLLPTLIGLAGPIYFAAALTFGLVFLGYGIAFARSPGAPSARQLLLVSLVYLPALLLVMALDKVSQTLLAG
jgi:heme o synthase